MIMKRGLRKSLLIQWQTASGSLEQTSRTCLRAALGKTKDSVDFARITLLKVKLAA